MNVAWPAAELWLLIYDTTTSCHHQWLFHQYWFFYTQTLTLKWKKKKFNIGQGCITVNLCRNSIYDILGVQETCHDREDKQPNINSVFTRLRIKAESVCIMDEFDVEMIIPKLDTFIITSMYKPPKKMKLGFKSHQILKWKKSTSWLVILNTQCEYTEENKSIAKELNFLFYSRVRDGEQYMIRIWHLHHK